MWQYAFPERRKVTEYSFAISLIADMKGIYLMAVKVIGAGLAGCEAAWQLAQAGIDVELYEMKPKKFTPAHKYKGFAELVCSNSLKADRIDSAAGMLKEEMRRLGSVTMECAAETKVSAGGALAVDREKFSDMVTAKIMENPHITVIEEEVTDIPDGDVIIATGPSYKRWACREYRQNMR